MNIQEMTAMVFVIIMLCFGAYFLYMSKKEIKKDYRMYIDPDRPAPGNTYIKFRNYDDAKDYIIKNGLPSFISMSSGEYKSIDTSIDKDIREAIDFLTFVSTKIHITDDTYKPKVKVIVHGNSPQDMAIRGYISNVKFFE